MAVSVETLGVDLRTRVKKLGAKEKATRRKCKLRFSLIKKNKAIQKSYMKVGVKKLLCAVVVPAGTWESIQWDGSKEKVEIEETDGSSTTSFSLFMGACALEVEVELSILATQCWAEGVWIGKWHHEQREAWMKQIQEVQSWKQVRGPAGAVMCI